MKKFIMFGSLVAATSVFAISDAEILDIFKAASEQGLKVKIDSKSKILDGKFEQIVIEISDKEQSQKQVVFSDGKYIFPDIIDIDQKVSYQGKFSAEQEKLAMGDAFKKLGKLISTLDKSKIVTLGNDPKKPTRYLFTDPECPYCRIELENIEKDLEKSNLKVILAPIPSHGESAIRKSIVILDELKGVKDDAKKIAIFRKYYAKDAADPKHISDDQVQKEQALIMKYFQTGAIRGVPAFIDEADLK